MLGIGRRLGSTRVRTTGFMSLPVALLLFAWVMSGIAVCAWAADESPELQASRKRYMMPSVTLGDYIASGADSIRIWADENTANVGDRPALFDGVRTLIAQYDRFTDEVARIYPRNQLEWMLITDAVADTLIRNLYPVLEAYQDAHSEEELGPGRQAFELELMYGLTSPPSRMLGFLAVTMTRLACSRADSLIASGMVEDTAGVHDGLLRNVRDWGSEYMQVHSDPISVYESRVVQGDWIIVRLEDRCGNSGGGTWRLGEQWMAVVDRDTTVTPVLELFAHEIHIEAVNCEGDERVIWIDLPNFRDVQTEVKRRTQERWDQREDGTRSR